MTNVETERARLVAMIWNSCLWQVMHTMVELGIPDMLADGPASAKDLAERSGTHANALYRLLRAATATGVVTLDGDLFALTTGGELLRAGVPGSVRDPLLWHGSDELQRSWRNLTYSVRTGQDAFRHTFGQGFYEHMAVHPEVDAVFNEAMAAGSRSMARVLATVPGFTEHARIADVGGGSGGILASVLAANPHMRGVLFDTDSGLSDAEATLSAAGVRERCDIVSGDFFTSVPSGCDAYLLKYVIHNWSDEEAIAILRHCREVMAPDAKLYIVESVIPEDPADFDSVMLIRDLNMLVMLNGTQRTEAEFARLLTAAGLRLDSAAALPPPGHPVSMLSASPV